MRKHERACLRLRKKARIALQTAFVAIEKAEQEWRKTEDPQLHLELGKKLNWASKYFCIIKEYYNLCINTQYIKDLKMYIKEINFALENLKMQFSDSAAKKRI